MNKLGFIKKIINNMFLKIGRKGKKILLNSSWLVSDKFFNLIIGVFITAIVARYFGPELYGEYNYALAFVSLFTAISIMGLDTLTIKSIVEKNYAEGTILFTSLVLRVVGGFILTILASIIIRIIEPSNQTMHLLVLIMSLTMVGKSFEVLEYYFHAHHKAKVTSLIRIIAYSFVATLNIVVVILGGELIHYTLVYLIDALIVGFALVFAYFHLSSNKSGWAFSFGYVKYVLSQNVYLILSGVMITIYMRIDQVMLGKILNSSAVGIYSAASKVAEMWYFIPLAIITSFKPVIMTKKIDNELDYLKSIQLLYSIVAWIGIFFGIVITLFAETIITILYGKAYIEAANILIISSWTGIFATLGSARGIWLISEGLQKYSIVYIGFGAIINIILNYLLIPKIGGYGAAIATLVSQILVAIIVPYLFYSTRVSSNMIIKGILLKGFTK